METVFFNTPLGIGTVTGDGNGITKVAITEDPHITESTEVPHYLKTAIEQLQEYFNGKRTEFDLVLNPLGTDFQKKVWDELLKVPFGKTATYLDIAKRLGDPKCIRAAATANGKNPLWIIVPCHRIIGSDGSLTGYAGGLWRKKWLLDLENPVKQQSLF
ncbi:cysteine methyltransferase [Flavobacteriaceae bacterium (ex Bugula neritina AB1)]|nr:cysteine methyltransferase [Flavobacteriaceae bacterium (ex Bugula neritina AB1)]